MRSWWILPAVVLAFLLCQWGCDARNANISNAQPPISVGTEVYLRSERAVVVAASDTESLSALASAQTARDEYGIRELFAEGRVFFVPTNTRVLIIDVYWGAAAYKVRLLEGEHVNEAVWVDGSAVSRVRRINS